jgi:hypothetical protein
MILDVSGIYAFVPTATYGFTDDFLLRGTLIAIEGSRRAAPATFRDRDQAQLRVTYQLNGLPSAGFALALTRRGALAYFARSNGGAA